MPTPHPPQSLPSTPHSSHPPLTHTPIGTHSTPHTAYLENSLRSSKVQQLLSASAPIFVPHHALAPQDQVSGDYPDPDPDNSVLFDSAFDDPLLQHFLASDQESSIPDPCSCHNLPLGSCKNVIEQFVHMVQDIRDVPGIPANMDGLRIPLPRPSFPIHAWKFALQGYFDASEIWATMEFGWDFSFLEDPSPKDATKNLASAAAAVEDVGVYIKTELAHAALLGPFREGQLPFDVFRSPIGTVPKIPVRRTITDCSQQGAGINSFISAHDHRGQVWKISLPTTETIVGLINENRALYPDEQLQMWKIDFNRWYR